MQTDALFQRYIEQLKDLGSIGTPSLIQEGSEGMGAYESPWDLNNKARKT